MFKKIINYICKYYLIITSLFIGLYAIFGGLMLVIDKSGTSMKLDNYLTSITFANDYLILGLLLVFIIGLTQMFSFYFLISNNNISAIITLISGALLLVWSSVQLYYIGWFVYSTVFIILSVSQIIISIIYLLLLIKNKK